MNRILCQSPFCNVEIDSNERYCKIHKVTKLNKELTNMISPYDMAIINRVLDDVRRQFPVTEPFEYEDKIRMIIHQHIWDVLATLQSYYEREAEFAGEQMAEEDKKRNPKDYQPSHPDNK